MDIDVVVFGQPTPVCRGRLCAPHPNIMGNVAGPSFVQFLRLAIKEHRNSYADVFFVHLMGNEDVVNYDNDDKHDDEDNKDDDGNDDENDDNNATINCWKQLGRRMRERDEDNDDDDDEDDDNEDVDKAINCWQQLGE